VEWVVALGPHRELRLQVADHKPHTLVALQVAGVVGQLLGTGPERQEGLHPTEHHNCWGYLVGYIPVVAVLHML